MFSRTINALRSTTQLTRTPLRTAPTRFLSCTPATMAPKRVEISSDFADGTMKELAFPNKDSESKVLVSKVKGSYYATSAKCTHYGAPLVKGVLTPEGRIVCPWHGACFNACTGDIEDAPGLNALSSFKVISEDGKYYVEAEEDKVTATREPTSAGSAASGGGKGVVIVGGGTGGGIAVEALRESGYEGPIKVISAESYLPIDRTKLSKALIPDPAKVALRSQAFYDKLKVEFVLGKTVSKVDFEKDTVELEDGEKVEYDQVILATGGSPIRLPVDGGELEGIVVLRQVTHTAEIDKALGDGKGEKKNLVIIGSSFVGLEAAGASAGRANVTVVGMEKAPFEKILGPEIGNGIRKFHESKGVKFYLPAELSHFAPSKDDSKKVGAVVLKDGTELPADLVILGVGVKPATGYLKESGLTLEKDGSVKVDELLKVEQVKKGNAFAIGDIATYLDVKSGKHVRTEHWNVASNHARAVAHTLTNPSAPLPFDKVAVFWSAQGQQLRYAGNAKAKEWKEVHIEGNPDELKFVAYYFVEDEVVAAASMQNDPIVARVSELMRQGKMLSASEIKKGKSPLDVQFD